MILRVQELMEVAEERLRHVIVDGRERLALLLLCHVPLHLVSQALESLLSARIPFLTNERSFVWTLLKRVRSQERTIVKANVSGAPRALVD